jgi:membrane-associated phospholipid phosphatase
MSTRIRCGVLLLTFVAVLGGGAIPAFAQDQQPPPTKPSENPANPHRPVWKLFTDIGKDFAHLPSRDTLLWLAAGGGLAFAVHPLDDDLNGRLVGSSFWSDFFEPGRIIGYGATQFGTAAATYAWGKTRKEPKVVHLGVDLLRAQIVTQLLTYGVKVAVRRDRPDGSGGYSFPSGHASVTFASATVLQRHLGWRAAVPTYSVASYVAISRLHENRHFLSDVTFGAALGIVAGRTVTRHGRDSWVLLPSTVPGGVEIVLARVQ